MYFDMWIFVWIKNASDLFTPVIFRKNLFMFIAMFSSRSTKPLSPHIGQFRVKMLFKSGRSRFLVSSTSPSWVIEKIRALNLSRLRNFSKIFNSSALSSVNSMSMKSTITIPPIERNLNCRAISSAASRFVSSIVWRMSGAVVNFPLFTSMTVSASVWSMTR